MVLCNVKHEAGCWTLKLCWRFLIFLSVVSFSKKVSKETLLLTFVSFLSFFYFSLYSFLLPSFFLLLSFFLFLSSIHFNRHFQFTRNKVRLQCDTRFSTWPIRRYQNNILLNYVLLKVRQKHRNFVSKWPCHSLIEMWSPISMWNLVPIRSVRCQSEFFTWLSRNCCNFLRVVA